LNKKILIIDDEPDVLKYLTTVLSDFGNLVICAESSQDGWTKMLKDKPDLITLDIMMPGQSGISFYLKAKADDRFAEIPIIILSGIKEAGEFDFRELVPDPNIPAPEAFIEKPINVRQFIETIDNILTNPKNIEKT